MTENNRLRNPFVGPVPFDENTRQYFHGRDEEIAILEGLVMARRAVLLFAQSGAGKSSLVQAGLIPELTMERHIGRGPAAVSYHKMRVLPVLSVGGAIPEGLGDTIPNVYIFTALFSLFPDANPGELANLSLTDGLERVLIRSKQQVEPVEFDPDANPDTLLIFDQFEELFTFHPERWREREAFFRQVAEALEANPDLHVLFTMREDYIAELTPYANLLPDQLRSRFRLERLQREAALQAVTQPAARAGIPFGEGVAEGLVDNLRRIQAGKARQNGSTPQASYGTYVEPVHLQIVCRQLWDNLPPGRSEIQDRDVQAFGDVDQALIGFYEGALKQALGDWTARTVIMQRQIQDARQADKTARRGLLRLRRKPRETGISQEAQHLDPNLAPSSQGLVSPRRLRRWFDGELITPAGTRGLIYQGETNTEGMPNHVVTILENAYIIRAEIRGNDKYYELAHDRLVDPIREANRRWQESYFNPLEAASRAWLDSGQSPDKLGEGAPLQEALAYAAVNPDDVLPEERRFLEESQRMQEVRHREEKRRARWRRNLIILGGVVTAALGALAIFALSQANEAQIALAESLRNERRAVAVQLAAYSQTELSKAIPDPSLALMLAEGAIRTTLVTDDYITSQASEALVKAISDAPPWRMNLPPRRNVAGLLFAIYSPDGTRIATAGNDGIARVLDAATGKVLVQLTGHTDWVRSVAFNQAGDRIVTASDDYTARVWNAVDGTELVRLEGHGDWVRSANFSPDGSQIVTASDDGTARIWDAANGRQISVLEGHTDYVRSARFSPDGSQVVTASDDETARIWNAADGKEVRRLTGHGDWVFFATFSPDGALVATASGDATARIWDATSGQELMVLVGHDGAVNTAAFSPNSSAVVTAGDDTLIYVWDAATGQELRQLAGHTEPVRSALFDPSGQFVVSASDDVSLRIWDVASGTELPRGGHTGPIRSAMYSPDGRRIITAGDDRTARIWNTLNGDGLGILVGHQGPINCASFSPDGSLALTASDDGTARIWDAASGQELRQLTGHGGAVAAASFSPDGQRIVTAGEDATARIWDARTGQELAVITGHEGPIYFAHYSADGKRIVTASWDTTARTWDAETGQLLVQLRGHEGRVRFAEFSADGSRIVTAGDDTTARIWDASTGQELLKLTGHQDVVRGVAFSPDGERVVTASDDTTARVWSARNGDELILLSGHVGAVLTASFRPDGQEIVTASQDTTARIWDARGGRRLAPLSGHRAPVRVALFSHSGSLLLTASNDTTARIWDAATGQPLRILSGHTAAVRSAAFSADDAQVLTASEDGTARIWDTQSGQELRRIEHPGEKLSAAGFSPDDRLIATVSTEGLARLWDAQDGTEVRRLEQMEERLTWVAFSPDGTRLVTASAEGSVRIWDVDSGQPLTQLLGHEGTVHRAAFSPDGTRVITAGKDETARIWDAETGQELVILIGHKTDVFSAAFSPLGLRAVTAGKDRTARIWDAETGQELLPLGGHTASVWYAAFSPDGNRVITASADRTARVWPSDLDELLATSALLIQRDPPVLTPDERLLFGLSGELDVRQGVVQTAAEEPALPTATQRPEGPQATATTLPTVAVVQIDTPTPTGAPAETAVPPTDTPTLPPTATPIPRRPGAVTGFELDLSWRRGDQPYGNLAYSTAEVRFGSRSGRIDYEFPAVADNFVVFLVRPVVPMTGQPPGLIAYVFGDGSGHFLNAWIQDAAGEVRQYSFGQVNHTGWQEMRAPFDDTAGWPNVHISGADNGQLDYPVSFFAFVLDGVPDGQASSGTIFLDEVVYDEAVIGATFNTPTAAPTNTPGIQPTATPRAQPTATSADAATPTQVEATPTTEGQATATVAAQPTATSVPQPTPTEAPPALSGRLAFPVFDAGRGTYDIYVANLDGSGLQRVREAASQPALSPNGQQIAFRSLASDSRGLTIMNALGGGEQRLSSFLEDGLPSWSPNGQTVVFFSRREGDRRSRIYQANVGGGDFELKPGGQPLFAEYPSWGSSGRIVLRSTGAQVGLAVVNADGGDQAFILPDGSATAPSLSPSGAQVVFMSQRDGNWEVYRIDASGIGLLRLTTDGANDGLPAWSPDGQTVAFLSDRGGQWAVWAMSADGSNQRQLFAMPGSPNGFVRNEPDYNNQGWTEERLSWGR